MTRCFEPREIARALELPEGDPGRRHLETCPRCRSLAMAYYEFIESGDADVEFSAADKELQARLSAAFRERGNPRRAWWTMTWPRPVWASLSVVLAAAAVVLLTGELPRLRGGDLPPLGGTLRGEDPDSGVTALAGADGLALAWPDDPRSDGTVVVFYDPAMDEIGRLATAGAHLRVAPDDPRAAAAYCRLLRVAEGDTIARSAVVATRPARE